MPEVLIVGAGPGGLAMAACLRKVGADAQILDTEGRVGGAYDRLYRQMPLVSPWSMNRLPHDRALNPVPALTAGAYADYLRAYAILHDLVPLKGKVSTIASHADGAFRIETTDYGLAADYVVLATGMYSYPVQPEIAGTPSLLQIHAAQYQSAETFRDRRVLIVGSGMSAFEIGRDLMDVARRIDLSVRRYRAPFRYKVLGLNLLYLIRPLEWLSRYTWKSFCDWHPPANDRALVPWIRNGTVRLFGSPSRVDGETVSFSDGEKADFDAIIWATGYRYEVPFLPKEVSAARQGVRQCQSKVWPNLFFVGYPCVRSTASSFLRGIAEDTGLIARRIARSLRRASSRDGISTKPESTP